MAREGGFLRTGEAMPQALGSCLAKRCRASSGPLHTEVAGVGEGGVGGTNNLSHPSFPELEDVPTGQTRPAEPKGNLLPSREADFYSLKTFLLSGTNNYSIASKKEVPSSRES